MPYLSAVAHQHLYHLQILKDCEPTGNLDHKTTESIFELIQTLNAEQNIAFLLVTHDMSLAQKLSRCLTMQDGILKEGA